MTYRKILFKLLDKLRKNRNVKKYLFVIRFKNLTGKFLWLKLPYNTCKRFTVPIDIFLSLTLCSPVQRLSTVHVRLCCGKTSHIRNRRATRGGSIWGISPPEIFRTLHSNFDICRNFQRIKMKFCILIIFEKSFLNFLCLVR